MNLNDLICLGWLGVKKDRNGFYKFFSNDNFQPNLLNIKDIFLIFKSQKVRYVTIDFVQKKNKIFCGIHEKDVNKEIDAAFGKVKLFIEKSQLFDLNDEFLLLEGIKVIYKNKKIAVVQNTIKQGDHKLIIAKKDNGEELMIPDVDKYVLKKDKFLKAVFVQNIEELTIL